MDLQKEVQKKTEEMGDLYPYIFALVLACICGNITMILFQVASFNRGAPWYYVIPYSWLMVLISIQFITSLLLTYKFKSQRSEIKDWRHYYRNLFFWLHTCALWVVLTTVLMLSWHAVFIMLGFILNPFRALILTVIYATGTICAIIMFSVIFSFCQLILKCIRAKKFHTFFAQLYTFSSWYPFSPLSSVTSPSCSVLILVGRVLQEPIHLQNGLITFYHPSFLSCSHGF